MKNLNDKHGFVGVASREKEGIFNTNIYNLTIFHMFVMQNVRAYSDMTPSKGYSTKWSRSGKVS